MTARAIPVATAPSVGVLVRAGALVAAATTAATVAAGVVLRAIVNPDPAFEPLSVPAIVITTVLYTTVATAVYGLIVRRSTQPRRRWLQVAGVGFLLSLVPNIGLILNPAGAPFAGLTTTAALALTALHFVAAPIVVFGLLRLAPAGDR